MKYILWYNLWLQAWSLHTQKAHLWHGEWSHGYQSSTRSFQSYSSIYLFLSHRCGLWAKVALKRLHVHWNSYTKTIHNPNTRYNKNVAIKLRQQYTRKWANKKKISSYSHNHWPICTWVACNVSKKIDSVRICQRTSRSLRLRQCKVRVLAVQNGLVSSVQPVTSQWSYYFSYSWYNNSVEFILHYFMQSPFSK